MSKAFDAEALMDRVDDDLEFLEETVDMLDEDCPPLLDEVRAAAASRDAEALIKPAHTLKSVFSNFCAGPAETAARELEEMGRAQGMDSVEETVERLERETERLKEALLEFLRAKKE